MDMYRCCSSELVSNVHLQWTLRLHLPVKMAIVEILPEREKTDKADPAWQRLPAPGLRRTWAQTYVLLTQLVSQVGWDELLKTQSAVFVMGEEYRMQKAQAEVAATSREAVTDDDASTEGVRAPPSVNIEGSSSCDSHNSLPTSRMEGPLGGLSAPRVSTVTARGHPPSSVCPITLTVSQHWAVSCKLDNGESASSRRQRSRITVSGTTLSFVPILHTFETLVHSISPQGCTVTVHLKVRRFPSSGEAGGLMYRPQ